MTRRLFLLALVFAFAGCRTQKAPSGPQRIVSLSPSITETLFAIGAGDLVVGVTDFCDYPPEVNQRKRAGSMLQPNYEEIVRLQPTLIVGEALQNSPEDKLKGIAETRVIPWLSISEVESGTRELGKLTHHEAQAEELVKQMQAKVRPNATPTSPRVLLTIAGAPGPFSEIWYVKRNSLHGSVLEASGARNAVAENVSGAPVLTLERIVALDPDAIIVLVSMDNVPETMKQKYLDAWKALPTLRAVKNNAVIVMTGTEVQSTGPRILQMVDRLSSVVKTIGASQ
jgi:iron complex transport system substrate-binding protein